MKKRILITTLLVIATSSAFSKTARDIESLTIETGNPTITGESAISMSFSWHIDEGIRYSGTGLTFINGSRTAKPDDSVSIASKMQTAVKESLMAQEPSRRGVEAVQLVSSDNIKKPELKLLNKSGYSLNEIVIRDYSHQRDAIYKVKPVFSDYGVNLAIDMVYVDSIVPSQSLLLEETESQPIKALGGGLEIAIMGQSPMMVATADLTSDQIEQEIALLLSGAGAFVSNEQLFENLRNTTTRNIKPFDGSEVQFRSLNGNSIRISVNDPSISAILKFKYPDETNTRMVIPIPVVFLMLFIIAANIGYVVWKSNASSAKEESDY